MKSRLVAVFAVAVVAWLCAGSVAEASWVIQGSGRWRYNSTIGHTFAFHDEVGETSDSSTGRFDEFDAAGNFFAAGNYRVSGPSTLNTLLELFMDDGRKLNWRVSWDPVVPNRFEHAGVGLYYLQP